jgi:hypothetical protein
MTIHKGEKMNRKSLSFGLLAGLLALALTHPAPARAVDADVSATVPLGIVNTCNGEYVSLMVTFHTVARSSSDGTSTKYTTDIHGSGTGSLGNAYNIAWTNLTSNNVTGLQNETTIIHDLVLVSLGPAPNLVSQNVTHLTVNANGTLTVDFTLGPTEKCLG